MCLAIPVKIISVNNEQALIDADGVTREINISLIEKVQPGDHVVVHAGFAIQKWDQDSVNEYNSIMEEMNKAESES